MDGSKEEIHPLIEDAQPDGIAIDYVSQNLYYTDDYYASINVCSYAKKLVDHCAVLINSSRTQNPRGIIVYPPTGLLIYSDWSDTPHIATAGMDGTNITIIVSEELK